MMSVAMEMDLQNRVTDLICDTLGIERGIISEDSDISRDLSADSLERAELIMCLEDEFGYRISEEEALRIRTVGDVVKFFRDRERS